MLDHVSFLVKRLGERLWIKPLAICVLSIGAVIRADLVDLTDSGRSLPEVSKESTETLLRILASGMLVMATLAVASMVSAYASASNSATPRSFPLIISDDVSQNALSAFIGAFIYSVVALVALMNGMYAGKASQFILFAMTVVVLAFVIFTFIRWVDKIARLGRLGQTIEKVESATEEAFRARQLAPRLGGVAALAPPDGSRAVFGRSIGYLQRVDVSTLQSCAAKSRLMVVVAALPGTFCTPNRPLTWIVADDGGHATEKDVEKVAHAFTLGDARVFEQDPRFGLVVLSEIASRALPPAVNDPGTAIGVTGPLVRLLSLWTECGQDEKRREVWYDRVAVPELSLADMFDDAFTGIARDGAALVEVMLRLLKALESLSALGDAPTREAALQHARLTLQRAEMALTFPPDLTLMRAAAKFVV